jgi:hypothetical protein
MIKTFLLIIVGLSGDPEHGKTFHKWGTTLAESAARLGVAPAQMVYLVDEPIEGDKLVSGKATREEITKAIETLGKQMGPDDVVLITLIGHGSFNGRAAQFNVPGPDLAATDFNTLVAKLPSKQVVFVNTTSSSGPFVEALSGPGRTIVTATRNGAEQYATLFGGSFIEALSSEAADADKNKRISVLEAFNFARVEVEKAYKQKGLLATEHALLDDNGDKEGSQTPGVAGKDGKIAADGKVAAIVSFGLGANALPMDPKVRTLYEERLAYERQVDQLRILKDSMPPQKYQAELERLLGEILKKREEIRAAEGTTPEEKR